MSKKILNRKTVIKIVVVVVVLVGAAVAGGALSWYLRPDTVKQEAAKQALNDKVGDIQNKSLAGNYDDAHKAIDEGLNKSDISNDEKYALLYQQGITYENEKKYDKAIQSYKDASALQDNRAVAEAIARTAEAKGDYELSKTYYQKAISLINIEEPMAESDKKFYEYRIANMGKEEPQE